MKKGIAISASLALCASLGSITNVNATSIVDTRFPEFNFLPVSIYPGSDGIKFISNNTALSGHLRSLTTFVSDNGYDLDELRANYPQSPTDNPSYIVHAELNDSDNFVIDTVTTQSIVAVMSSASSNILYYILDFWDGTLEVQRISYQNCIDEAGGKYGGLECRISRRGKDVVYKAYVDGVELVPEADDMSSGDEDIPQEDNDSESSPSNDGEIADEATSDDTSDTPITDDTISDYTTSGNAVSEKAQPSQNSQQGTTEQANPARDNSQEATQTATTTSNTIASNSSIENVKNTKTDENTAMTPSVLAATSGDVLPPSGPQSLGTAGLAATLTEDSESGIHWWAIYPLLVVASALSWFFLILPRRKVRNSAEQQQTK